MNSNKSVTNYYYYYGVTLQNLSIDVANLCIMIILVFVCCVPFITLQLNISRHVELPGIQNIVFLKFKILQINPIFFAERNYSLFFF